MKILFICTAYNSLSQRLALELGERGHEISVEYALSPGVMVDAVRMFQPDLVLCPFLTKRIPAEIYSSYMTLIVHPGPPGDEGPSALDWMLIGDKDRDESFGYPGSFTGVSAPYKGDLTRSHWGVTVLQAVEEYDAGPVWAFDQFEMSGDNAAMTKSELYRGPVTRCALAAVLAALQRIQSAHTDDATTKIPPVLPCTPAYRQQCLSDGTSFQGGPTYRRPLLKAADREVRDVESYYGAGGITRASSDMLVKRIHSADSQPGVLSLILDHNTKLFLYDAHVQRGPLPSHLSARDAVPTGSIMATRQGAVLVNMGDAPIWIGHIRRPKAKTDKYLHPKLPAVMALLELPDLAYQLRLSNTHPDPVPEWPLDVDPANPWAKQPGTYQQVWVEIEQQAAYVYTEFYNGAFSTTQCGVLLEALQWVLAQDVKAVVMMGGSGYFSNGIALNVIEGSPDRAAEGWANINAIDDVVQALLAPAGVVTFSALRGNAAAGGLALATAADFVLCADSVVLNPHYRALGLYGSEWHTYSWFQRCGEDVAADFVRKMLPMSAAHAARIGLVDHVLPNNGTAAQLVDRIKDFVRSVLHAKAGKGPYGASWTQPLSPDEGCATHCSALLANKRRYLTDLAGKPSATHEQLHAYLAEYKARELAQMQLDFFHPQRGQRFAVRCTAFVRKLVPFSTPLRFATHRRSGTKLDVEERDAFDELGGVPASDAVPRLPTRRPEFVPAAAESHASDSSDSSQTAAPSTAPTSPAEPAAGDDKPRSGKLRRFLQSLRCARPNPELAGPAPAAPLADNEPDCLFACYYANPDVAK